MGLGGSACASANDTWTQTEQTDNPGGNKGQNRNLNEVQSTCEWRPWNEELWSVLREFWQVMSKATLKILHFYFRIFM